MCSPPEWTGPADATRPGQLGKGTRLGLVVLRVLLVAMTLVATYTFIHRLRA